MSYHNKRLQRELFSPEPENEPAAPTSPGESSGTLEHRQPSTNKSLTQQSLPIRNGEQPTPCGESHEESQPSTGTSQLSRKRKTRSESDDDEETAMASIEEEPPFKYQQLNPQDSSTLGSPPPLSLSTAREVTSSPMSESPQSSVPSEMEISDASSSASTQSQGQVAIQNAGQRSTQNLGHGFPFFFCRTCNCYVRDALGRENHESNDAEHIRKANMFVNPHNRDLPPSPEGRQRVVQWRRTPMSFQSQTFCRSMTLG